MKWTIILFLIGTCGSHIQCEAQVKYKKPTVFCIVQQDHIIFKTFDLLIETEEIERLDILAKNDTVANNVKADIIVKFYIKPNVLIVNLDQIWKEFNLDTEFRHWNIKVDGFIPNNQKDLLASRAAIENVKVDELTKSVNIETRQGLGKIYSTVVEGKRMH